MNMRDRIKQEQESGGFRPHPVGTYDAVVEEIKERDWQGALIYDIVLRTSEGTCKVGLWKKSWDDMQAEVDAGRMKQSEAEESYVKAMGRVCRLYSDLGLEAPDGDTHVDIEEQAYERLGELVGRSCSAVVNAKKEKGKEDERIVFINAPKGAQKAGTGRAPARQTQTAFAGSPSIDEVPF